MKPIRFILLFHLIFFGITMVITLFFEKLGGEIFAGIFWFNIIYLILNSTIGLLFFILIKKVYKKGVNTILIANFLMGLIIIHFLVHLFNDTLPIYSVINSFYLKKYDETFWIALSLTGSYIFAFLNVCFLYKRSGNVI